MSAEGSARPKLLDLYCGAGGAAMGYHRAGFSVTGVDIALQPRYPFTFIQGDAIDYLNEHGSEYDVIHASPPCQAYSIASRSTRVNRHPVLVKPTRIGLRASGALYIIENVMGAPLFHPVMLCGKMFGLRVYRHRLFELNFPIQVPEHPRHTERTNWAFPRGVGYQPEVRARAARDSEFESVFGDQYVFEKGKRAMGIDWMETYNELSESIPPAYTEHIGWYALAALRGT